MRVHREMQDIVLTVEAVTIFLVDIFMGTKFNYILDRRQLLEMQHKLNY